MMWTHVMLAVVILCSGGIAGAQVTNSSTSVADAFLCTGSPNYEEGADLSGLNFGGAGTLAIAPASAAKGEFQSILQFNLADAVAQFNTTYGSNNWLVSAMSLDLASDYGVGGVQPNNPIFNAVSGGQFVIEWLAADDWVEGTGTPNLPTTDGVCFNSLPELLAQPRGALCTNTYVPPGNNIHVIWPLPLAANLISNLVSGSEVTFRFYAADNQIGYLFNSQSYGRGNQPMIHVVARPLLTIIAGALTNGGFQLTGLGSRKATYQIQASANLASTNWLTIGTATADTNGLIQFADTQATNAQRFYRLSQ